MERGTMEHVKHQSLGSIGTPSKNPQTKRKTRTPGRARTPSGGADNKTVPGPDGTASWVVAFAAFLINFIMAGLSRMSGILFVAFIEMFDTDRKGASMPFSVRSSTMNLLGPVVGILGQKYGIRRVSVMGGILGAVSSAACYFADDILWLTILWGGVNGVGTALVTTLTTVVVAQYFDKYRTTASGMSFSGACIGSFVFPPLIEQLLQLYGLGGSFLIVAGIILHTVPAAMILRKPIWVKMARKRTKDIEEATTPKVGKKCLPLSCTRAESNTGVDLNYLRSNGVAVFKLLTTDISVPEGQRKELPCPPMDEILKEMEDVYCFVGKKPVSLRVSEVPPKLRMKFANDCGFLKPPLTSVGDAHSPVRKAHSVAVSPKIPNSQCKPFIISKLNELYNRSEGEIMSSLDSEKSLYSQALKELRKLHKVYEAVKKRNIFANSRRPTTPKKHPKIVPKVLIPEAKRGKSTDSKGLWDNIKASVKIHSNPMFLLVAFCRAIHFSTFIPAVTIIVDYVMDKGYVEEDGKYVIAALSVGDLLGRLCLGWVTDRGFISLPKYMMVAMVLQGICTAALPMMMASMFTLLPTIVIYALLQGSVFVRHAVLIAKYMKSGEQSIASGCVNFFAGVIGFAVPYYVGFFRDTMGSYDSIFYLNGAAGAVGGLLWLFEPLFVKMDPPADDPEDKV